MSTKTEDALKTISEASASLDVPPHVLRFWESKFRSLRPLKRSGGRRYYRPADLATLRRIRQLLYVDGFTIKGAQKLVSGRTSVGKSSIILDSGVSSAETIASATAMLQDVKLRLAAVKKQLGS